MTFLHEWHIRQIRCRKINCFYESSIICCSGWVIKFDDVVVYVKNHDFPQTSHPQLFWIIRSDDRFTVLKIMTLINFCMLDCSQKWIVIKHILSVLDSSCHSNVTLQKGRRLISEYKINSMEFSSRISPVQSYAFFQ